MANGGTGTSTPSLVAGTGISISGSFPNQTVTSTVTGGVTSLNGQTGAITNTSLYAIGSYITGRPGNATNYAVNSTLAGSSLYALSTGAFWNNSTSSFYGYNNNVGGAPITGGSTLVNTGTWRCVSPSGNVSSNAYWPGLWVRIS